VRAIQEGDGRRKNRLVFFSQEAELWTVRCVCSDRDTGLTGCIRLIREARVAGGFGLGGQDIRRYPGARTFSLVGRVDNRLGQLFCVYGRSGLSSRAARQQDSKAEKGETEISIRSRYLVKFELISFCFHFSIC
jgi:hypothetical protein